MRTIKKWLVGIVREGVIDIPYKTSYESLSKIFPFIPIRKMREFLDEMEEKGLHGTSLAELYSFMLRSNLEVHNDKALHNYYELLPKLSSFEKAFKDEVIKDIEKKYEIEHLSGAGKVFTKKTHNK